MMADHLERIGQFISDYRLVRWLGGGGFGNVYLAERDSSQVAIKLLQIRLNNQDDFRAFINEARTMRLKHPHIIPLLDFGLNQENIPFLVMEYAPQGTLRDRHPKGSPVPLPTAIEYATQVASALQYAHEHHLVHRDVKPENMLVRSNGIILLSDFGIATAAHSTHSLSTNQGVGGTIPYMAPEQLEGKPRPASDQYALGIVVYEWLAGHCPFQGTAVEIAMQHTIKPPPSLLAQVSGLTQAEEEVLFKALAKDPKERFTSIQEFAEELQHASYPTTFLKPVPLVPDSPPPIETLVVPTSPASTPLPQETLLQDAKQKMKTVSLPPPISQNLYPSSRRASESTGILPPAHLPRHLPIRYKTLLLVMTLLILIGGGGYAYSVVNAHTIQLQAGKDTRVTAVTGKDVRTAVVAHENATATAKTSIDAYNAEAAQHGIMLGVDAQRTFNNPFERILNSTSISHLHQVWATAMGTFIYSSPIIANGLAYIGSTDDKLYAFDAATGQQKWAAPTGNAIRSTPAVANGLVYAGSWDHKLYAFDAMTGQQKWVAPVDNLIDSSLVVANGFAYVTSLDNRLYAFNAMTGQQKWVTATNVYPEGSPIVINGLIYTSSPYSGGLRAFDATTGQQKWVISITNYFITTSPVVADGLIYAASDESGGNNNYHFLYAFDATTGQQKWATSINRDTFYFLAVANGLVYMGSDDNKLYAFDAMTGRQKWATLIGNAVYSTPAIANGLLYLANVDIETNNENLYILDATSGQQKRIIALLKSSNNNSVARDPVVVANGFVYVVSLSGKLYAFSL